MLYITSLLFLIIHVELVSFETYLYKDILDFYKSLKVNSVERSKNRKESLGKVAKDAAFIFGALAVLGTLATAAAGTDRRKEVVARSEGKCENCGVKITNDESIVGHLDHDARRNGRYNSDSNVRVNCFHCETEIHLIHMGRSKDLGLSEEDNNSAVLFNMLKLIKQSPDNFIELFDKHSSLIDDDLFLRFFFNAPELIEQAFIDSENDLPIDPYQSLVDIANESIYDFMLFYFRKKSNVDFFLKSKDLELPIDILTSLELLREDNLEEFIRLSLGHRSKISVIFRENGKKAPDLKQILIKLETEDNPEFLRLVEDIPFILEFISSD
ncbi:MAG: hypothetical protein HOA85_03390 [Candidatus Pacebacteria bacterium]|nr:hypothetical protein [Candidatus Paceibacterota bacterium]